MNAKEEIDSSVAEIFYSRKPVRTTHEKHAEIIDDFIACKYGRCKICVSS